MTFLCISLVLILLTSVAVVSSQQQQQEQQQQEQPQQQRDNLLHSIAAGQIDTAYRLISQGHNPNIAEVPSGWTPLIHAVHRNDFHLTRALLNAGADIDQGCTDGWTPLMFACVHGHVDLIRLLLEYRANIHIVAKTGATALGSAKLGGNQQAMRLIEEAVSIAKLHEVIFEKESGIEAIILSASHSGDYMLVERLLKEGHSPNTVSTGGWTPLMLAAAGGNLQTIRVLVHYGANVNVQDDDGWSPLMFCAHSSNIPCVVFLLESQADIFLTNKDNATVLQMARGEGHVEAFNVIVSMTYCHEYVNNHMENVQSMIADGVDPDAIDCTQVKKAIEEHARQQEEARAANAGTGVTDSGLSDEIEYERVGEI